MSVIPIMKAQQWDYIQRIVCNAYNNGHISMSVCWMLKRDEVTLSAAYASASSYSTLQPYANVLARAYLSHLFGGGMTPQQSGLIFISHSDMAWCSNPSHSSSFLSSWTFAFFNLSSSACSLRRGPISSANVSKRASSTRQVAVIVMLISCMDSIAQGVGAHERSPSPRNHAGRGMGKFCHRSSVQ